MSNLGGYITLTKLSKKVGGPGNFVFLVFSAGTVVGTALSSVVRKAFKQNNKKAIDEDVICTVKTSTTFGDGITFNAGDTFRVLEKDRDSVLIEIIGDKNNPYFVSGETLEKISNYVNEDKNEIP